MAFQQGNQLTPAFFVPVPQNWDQLTSGAYDPAPDSWGAADRQAFEQGQHNTFSPQALPLPPRPRQPPPPAPTAVAPGPDDRVPNQANQIAPPAEPRRPSTKQGRTSDSDYRFTKSTAVHDFEICDNPNTNGGLRAGMHLWLRFEHNGTTIEEHLVFVRKTIINNRHCLQFDRYDGNHILTRFGNYNAMGNLVRDLAANYWTNVDLRNKRMKYEWWHVYKNADYTITPANHGQYLGDLAFFRKNFCRRNGWAPE